MKKTQFNGIWGLTLNPYVKLREKMFNLIANLRIKNRDGLFYSNGWITINHPEKLKVGNNVYIMQGAFFDTAGGVEIGDNVVISRNVRIYSSSHNYEGSTLPNEHNLILKKVTIGNNVWIGDSVKIIPGITIGDGAIIQLGTVVNKDVPPLAIVGNQQINIFKTRNKEHYERLVKEKRFFENE